MLEKLKQVCKNIQVQHYRDYRTYLNDIYQALKASTNKYSYRQFSELLGFSSSNYLHLVIKGKRKLSKKRVAQVIKILELNDKDAEHFSNMIKMDHLDFGQKKAELMRKVINKGGKPGAKRIEKRKYKYFSHWYYPAIREMIELENFKDDPAWIAKQLTPAITKTEAVKAIKALIDLGLIKRDESGKLKVCDKQIATPPEVTGEFIKTYHQEMLKRAANSMDITPAKERDLSAVTFGIDEETSKQIKKEIQLFWQRLQEIATSSPQGSKVMQLTIQWFPLTKNTNHDEDSES